MSDTKRVMGLYRDLDEFECLLMDACEAAVSEQQVEFINDLMDDFSKCGGYMLITDRQHNSLKQIAEGDNDEFPTTSH